jgi:hypothetical protein
VDNPMSAPPFLTLIRKSEKDEKKDYTQQGNNGVLIPTILAKLESFNQLHPLINLGF